MTLCKFSEVFGSRMYVAEIEATAPRVFSKPLIAAADLPAGLLASQYVYHSTGGKAMKSHSIAGILNSYTVSSTQGLEYVEFMCGATAGDSACSIPPQTIPAECLEVIRDWTTKLAKKLKVVGLINIQYCIQDNQVSVLCYSQVS